MSTKAQTDVINFGLIIFLFAIATFISLIVFQKFNTAMQGNDDIPTVVKTMLTGQSLLYTELDYAYIFLIVGLMVSLFLSGYFIETHRIFLVISIMLLLVDVVLGAIIANSYDLIVKEYPAVSASLPITVKLASLFPMIMLIGGVVFAIGLYAKGNKSSNGGAVY